MIKQGARLGWVWVQKAHVLQRLFFIPKESQLIQRIKVNRVVPYTLETRSTNSSLLLRKKKKKNPTRRKKKKGESKRHTGIHASKGLYFYFKYIKKLQSVKVVLRKLQSAKPFYTSTALYISEGQDQPTPDKAETT